MYQFLPFIAGLEDRLGIELIAIVAILNLMVEPGKLSPFKTIAQDRVCFEDIMASC